MGYHRFMNTSTAQPRLSVVYATYNEAENLARSLDSIKNLADELIVVDGSSTDETREIAKQYGAKVIKTTNKPIFHINKQMAMDEARGIWVLQMDADEVVDEEMQQHIQEVIAGDLQDQPAAFWLRRRNWYLGRFLRKGGQYPDPVIRFYQRGKAHLPMKSVHEQMEVDGEVGWLRGHLLHYNSPNFGVTLRKWNAYTTLEADHLEAAKLPINAINAFKYIVWLPLYRFLKIYFRHKGFLDGMAGLVFAVLSGLYFAVSYIKYWEKVKVLS